MSVRCRTIKGESTSDSAGGIASSVSLYSLACSPTFVFRASASSWAIWLFLCLAGTSGGGPEVPATAVSSGGRSGSTAASTGLVPIKPRLLPVTSRDETRFYRN